MSLAGLVDHAALPVWVVSLTVPAQGADDEQYRATSLVEGGFMQIRFLGKETDHGDSPTLYATDRGSYLVQGWKVSDPQILAKLKVPEGETVVEIYARLMTHLVKDGLSGVVTSWVPPIVEVRDNGNLVIQGRRVTDRQALAQMTIPDHEEVVEVDKEAIQALLSEG